MKFFQLFTVNFLLSLIFIISINAQTEKMQTTISGKIAVINFDLLKDEKTGIKDLADIYKKFEIEFRHKDNELKPLYEERQKAVEKLQELENSTEIRVTKQFIEDLTKQFDDANYKFEKKLKETKALFDKRKLEVDTEAKSKIVELFKLFAKEKDLTVFLNSSQNNFLLKDEAIDATDEFIKFYYKQTEKK